MHWEALSGLAWLFHLLVLSQCVCDYKTSKASHLDTGGTCWLLGYHYRWSLNGSECKAVFRWRQQLWASFSFALLIFPFNCFFLSSRVWRAKRDISHCSLNKKSHVWDMRTDMKHLLRSFMCCGSAFGKKICDWHVAEKILVAPERSNIWFTKLFFTWHFL